MSWYIWLYSLVGFSSWILLSVWREWSLIWCNFYLFHSHPPPPKIGSFPSLSIYKRLEAFVPSSDFQLSFSLRLFVFLKILKISREYGTSKSTWRSKINFKMLRWLHENLKNIKADNLERKLRNNESRVVTKISQSVSCISWPWFT